MWLMQATALCCADKLECAGLCLLAATKTVRLTVEAGRQPEPPTASFAPTAVFGNVNAGSQQGCSCLTHPLNRAVIEAVCSSCLLLVYAVVPD
jgi:hypothetical protein